MHSKRNIAQRMGRWSGTHPKTAIFGWIAFVLVAFFLGNSVFTAKTLDENDQGVGESGRAAKTLDEAFTTAQERASESVLVQTFKGPLAQAEKYYKWQDETGTWHYSNKPPKDQEAQPLNVHSKSPSAWPRGW